jgi:hypothetical protein
VAAAEVRLLLRQPPLVDQHDGLVFPRHRPDHARPPKRPS